MIMTIWGNGKTFQAIEYDSLEKKTVTGRWNNDQSDALDGCICTYMDSMEFNDLSYDEDAPNKHCEVRSGNVNVLPEEINWIEVETFKTKQAAFDYISANHKVNDRALAVTFIDEDKKKKYMVGGWCKGNY